MVIYKLLKRLNKMKKEQYKILRTVTDQTYQIPIYLEEKINNLGVMVDFDGEIEQVEQTCNFTYSGYNHNLTIFNTVNTNKYKSLIDVEYTINWGDGNYSQLPMTKINDVNLSSLMHTYSNSLTGSTLEITVNSPWRVEKIKRNIKLPFINDYGWYNDLGTLIFEIPYNTGTTTQDYLLDYRKTTGETVPTIITFMGIGKSRINEFKKYGDNGYTIIFNTGTTEGLGVYTGYTIDGLSYFDYPNDITYITGVTKTIENNILTLMDETILTLNDFTLIYIDNYNESYNGILTRDENLLGFISEPQIYSDIFIERGKQSLIERNLRLNEIDNMGELEIYGGGYFKVKKQ